PAPSGTSPAGTHAASSRAASSTRGSSGSASPRASSSAYAPAARSTASGVRSAPASTPSSRARSSSGAVASINARSSRSVAANGESPGSPLNRHSAARPQPRPPRPDSRLLPGQVLVQLRQHLGEVLPGVVREHVPHLGEPQPQLGQPPDPREQHGMPQRVLPIPVAPPLRLRQQPQMVV